jgi:integrase
MQHQHEVRITGHLTVEQRTRGRVWIAKYTLADGRRTRKTLGRAWAKDSGRRTPRGAVVWRVADGGKPDETYLTPREAAEALERLLEAERRSPTAIRAARGKTFGDAVDAWLKHVEFVRGVAPSTLRGYRSITVKLFAEWPAETELRCFRPEAVEAYQVALLTTPEVRGAARPGKEARPRSRTTVRNRMLVLRSILSRAHQQGWTAANPAAGVQIVADPGAHPDFNVLEPGQVEKVARAMLLIPEEEIPRARGGGIHLGAYEITKERRAVWADAVRLLAYTGLRFGELRDLRWRDIDLAGRLVHVRRNTPTSAPAGSGSKRPKGRRGRSLPLIDQAVEVLERIGERGYPSGPEDLVLCTRFGGMLEPGKVRGAFYRGLRAAGLGYLREKDNPMTLHDLRHTFGTIAVRKLPLSAVQAYLGHADITTTMRYVHHVPRADAAQRLSEAFAA